MRLLFLMISCFALLCCSSEKETIFFNSDENIEVQFSLGNDGSPYYRIFKDEQVVLDSSSLGLIRQDADFSRNLSIVSISEGEQITDSYTMLHGKQSDIDYSALRYVVKLENPAGESMEIIFQLSSDGVAFRYHFPSQTEETKKITKEVTEYAFPEETRAWLQPMSRAKTGWESTNPSYEEEYLKNVSLDSASPIGEGFVYPALFKTPSSWIVISESGLHSNYVGSRLLKGSKTDSYVVGFPQEEERFPGGALNPKSSLPWTTPWRIIAIGDLATIVESTLGTDLATPAIDTETEYIEPGLSSWSWVLLKDDFTNYETSKRFIDYASEMDWTYTLIDADWDRKIGYERMAKLIDYARERNVKILLWYNSAGDWNTTPYTPKSKLLTAEDRNKEFTKLKKMGAAGLKIDFFGGEGQSMIQYYHDIMKDAAKHELVLNFHGATLPRGWHRTYPNLLTVEAIKGYEFITFTQEMADAAPTHAAIIPFTRNLFDPMDFTPMVLDEIPGIKRKTTPAFELALPVLFLSGIQHIAEIPEGMARQPDFVVEYLKDIPVNWEESRFISGFPGKEVVMARRKGETWHIVGVNGESIAKEVEVDLTFLTGSKEGLLISDGEDDLEQTTLSAAENAIVRISMEPNGGFVMKF